MSQLLAICICVIVDPPDHLWNNFRIRVFQILIFSCHELIKLVPIPTFFWSLFLVNLLIMLQVATGLASFYDFFFSMVWKDFSGLTFYLGRMHLSIYRQFFLLFALKKFFIGVCILPRLKFDIFIVLRKNVVIKTFACPNFHVHILFYLFKINNLDIVFAPQILRIKIIIMLIIFGFLNGCFPQIKRFRIVGKLWTQLVDEAKILIQKLTLGVFSIKTLCVHKSVSEKLDIASKPMGMVL